MDAVEMNRRDDGAAELVSDREDSGCPALVHEVRITTAARYYDLIFLLDEPSSSVVAQLLDSATVQ